MLFVSGSYQTNQNGRDGKCVGGDNDSVDVRQGGSTLLDPIYATV
jgi:hypothetical protein